MQTVAFTFLFGFKMGNGKYVDVKDFLHVDKALKFRVDIDISKLL